MSFALEAGYLPLSVAEMMSIIKDNINTQFGTDYTDETFLGTNFYKYFYSLIQRLQENEVKTSEIFLRMQEYFNITNEKIQRPNTTHPGIFDFFKDAGYFVSTKPPEDGDAGKVFICVNVDDGADGYADTKIAICNLVKVCVVAGVISQGDQVEELTLSNGQAFEFKYSLPNKIPVLLRLTTVLSENNQFTISSPDVVKQKLFDNIAARYFLGKDFEPQRYFSVVDAPWAASVSLEWSDDDGSNYYDTVFSADFDDVYTFDIGDIELVEE